MKQLRQFRAMSVPYLTRLSKSSFVSMGINLDIETLLYHITGLF